LIDLHSHVLPGLDDGARDLEDSIELARTAQSDGTEILAATPHLREDYPGVRVEEIASRCARLNRDLPDDCAVEIVSGGEVALTWAREALREDLALASYGQRGTDLLVETPVGPLANDFEEAMLGISGQGFRILLAHPERNPTFQWDRRRLSALTERGVLVQVTAGSLAAENTRSRSRRLARALVEDGLAHVIASDAHSSNFPRFWLSAGVEAAARIAPLRAEWMVTDAPAAILAGEPLPAAPSERTRRRRFG